MQMEGTLMKCAHPGCKCMTPPNGSWGKYCSEHCQKAGDTAEPRCGCGHASCAWPHQMFRQKAVVLPGLLVRKSWAGLV